MLFTGYHDHTIDSKHRLAIPAEIRGRLDPERDGMAFYLVPGANGFLWLWPERTFERLSQASRHTLLPAEEMMEFEELLYSQARRLEIDGAGRIRLPEPMLRRYGLGTRVTIIGVKDHLELRDTAQWQQSMPEKLDKQAEIMLRARQALEEQRDGGGKECP